MRILVTGGAGLIGTEVTRRLALEGHEVVVFDLKEADLSGLATAEQIRGDIRSEATLRKSLIDVGGIVHLAAIARVQDAEQDPKTAMDVNANASELLARLANELPRPPLFVHASSREVYGEPTSLPVSEDALVRPVNVYGRSKVAAERAIADFAKKSGSTPAILRFSNVYGSARDHPRRVIPAFMTQAIKGRPLEVQDGEKILDFTHVEDAGRAVSAVLSHLARRPRGDVPLILNVATGVGTSLRELAERITKAVGSNSKIVERTARDFDVRRYVGDPGAIAEEIGFRCAVQLQDGIRRTALAFQARAEAR